MIGRFMNTMYALLGSVGIVLSARLLVQHQHVVLTRKAFTEDPKVWAPTIFPLLLSIWLFVYGLVGLIDAMRGKSTIAK
jgi:hypothetical protein